VAATLALALLATAAGCGARWTDEQREALRASNERGDGDRGRGGGSTGGTGGSDLAGGGTGGTGGTGGGTGGTGGTGGAAGGAEGSASGPRPCSAPSDAPGVTDDEIAVATISTVSGPVPGLGESSEAAARAYIAYRNATGGVCGREIVLRTADDGADNGRYRALVSELSSQALGIVGGLGTGDAGGADVVEAAQLPVVNTPISETFQNASTVFDINPPFADVNAPTGKFRYLYDQGVRTAALVYIAADQTRSEAVGKQKPQMEAAGIRIVNEQAVPLATLSYDAAARAVANSKADYLLLVADESIGASMARSMHGTGYQPKFEEYLIAYGSDFEELAGAEAAEGASTWIRGLPNEERGNAEQAAFLEWMDRVAPGVAQDTFAVDSWAGAKAFFDSLEALPGPISREALLAQLRGVAEYDAGGLIGPIQLGPKLNNGCAIGMKLVSGEWERMAPAEGFLC
jgi:ABC-type branched-subunit amino acid transport system substrate-binding protein